MIPQELINFVTESNRIEGILREPTDGELEVHQWVLAQPKLTIRTLTSFVTIVQPGAVLRHLPGLDVHVGRHVAPLGGPSYSIFWNILTSAASTRPTLPMRPCIRSPMAMAAPGACCGCIRWAARRR